MPNVDQCQSRLIKIASLISDQCLDFGRYWTMFLYSMFPITNDLQNALSGKRNIAFLGRV